MRTHPYIYSIVRARTHTHAHVSAPARTLRTHSYLHTYTHSCVPHDTDIPHHTLHTPWEIECLQQQGQVPTNVRTYTRSCLHNIHMCSCHTHQEIECSQYQGQVRTLEQRTHNCTCNSKQPRKRSTRRDEGKNEEEEEEGGGGGGDVHVREELRTLRSTVLQYEDELAQKRPYNDGALTERDALLEWVDSISHELVALVQEAVDGSGGMGGSPSPSKKGEGGRGMQQRAVVRILFPLLPHPPLPFYALSFSHSLSFSLSLSLSLPPFFSLSLSFSLPPSLPLSHPLSVST